VFYSESMLLVRFSFWLSLDRYFATEYDMYDFSYLIVKEEVIIMGYPMEPKFDSELFSKDKLYGTTTMGARGQVVIPVEARKDLNLQPGDHLLVMGKFGKALGLVKTEHMQEIIAIIMKQIVGTSEEEKFKEYLQNVFGQGFGKK
jgi:AbrB family looped-hinge helix DNA binding protein